MCSVLKALNTVPEEFLTALSSLTFPSTFRSPHWSDEGKRSYRLVHGTSLHFKAPLFQIGKSHPWILLSLQVKVIFTTFFARKK